MNNAVSKTVAAATLKEKIGRKFSNLFTDSAETSSVNTKQHLCTKGQ
jgi:hypothetical protein